MTAKDYLRISLLFPYIGWFIFGLLGSNELDLPLPEALRNKIYMYIAGVVIWFVPYTLLALVLRAWSNNKEEKQILRNFAFTPFYLALIFSGFILLATLGGKVFEEIIYKRFDFVNSIITVDASSLMVVRFLSGYSIFYGYFFVIVAYIIYKYLKRRNKFVEEPNESGDSD